MLDVDWVNDPAPGERPFVGVDPERPFPALVLTPMSRLGRPNLSPLRTTQQLKRSSNLVISRSTPARS